jgi:hypothetical protein
MLLLLDEGADIESKGDHVSLVIVMLWFERRVEPSPKLLSPLPFNFSMVRRHSTALPKKGLMTQYLCY